MKYYYAEGGAVFYALSIPKSCAHANVTGANTLALP